MQVTKDLLDRLRTHAKDRGREDLTDAELVTVIEQFANEQDVFAMFDARIGVGMVAPPNY